MTDSTEAQTQGGQTVAEGTTSTQQPAPRSDAEAEQQGASQQQPQTDAAKEAADKAAAEKAQQEVERKKNRTKAYIDRINAENADNRRKIADLEARLPKPPEPRGAPKPEDYGFDQAAYQQALTRHELQEARTQWDNEQKTKAEADKQQQAVNAYQQRASAFAADHDDYLEVVGSIDPVLLPPELQAAIMGHEKGPEIAYQLAQNEDELFNLASMRPEMLERAVARFASRMSDAPSESAANAQAANSLAAPAIATQPKPISQAPAPAPRVGGRSPTEIPPEKMTDDEWYEREVEKRRKR